MISHGRAEELISARMDAPLTPAEHRVLQNHLASCAACRAFVSQIDDVARELQVLPRLAPSPIVSRGVLSAIRANNSGWGWLRGGLQALSSPGMAVASSLALIVALASALIVALNMPGGNNPGTGTEPQETIAAAEVAIIPTDVPPTATQAPAAPTQAVPAEASEPTATKTGRSVTLASDATKTPAKTPTPRPTATSVPIEAISVADQPAVDSTTIQPSSGEAPVYEEPSSDQTLAMAPEETTDTSGETVDIAQEAAPEAVAEQPAESTDTGEAVDAAPSESTDAASEPDNASEKNGGRKGNGDKSESEAAPAAEPEPTRPVGPLPVEAIAALEGAGGVPNINLPPSAPEPMDPMLPDQSFLPVTPTPAADGTPTPESEPATEAESPQLADDWSGDLPIVAEAPPESNADAEKVKDKGKKDKSSKGGDSHEEQQAAWDGAPMGYAGEAIDFQPLLEQPVDYQQTSEPAELQQTTEYPVEDPAATGATTDPALTSATSDTTASDATTTDPASTVEPERQIDPATGMEIDPATGYLIDPTTGYLIDRANGRVIDPRTGYQVHPMTGLLIDPATGALLDPNTLAIVVPAGFGDDQPAYVPGSDDMHGDIEDVVDDTYNNATIQIQPPTDGPVQPIGEIVVPTESGEALEIS